MVSAPWYSLKICCSVKVVSYIFNSPLNVFELLDSDSELSQMIIEYGSTLRQQIYQLLVTHASKSFSSVNKKVRKNVIFNDQEMHANYSEPPQLYSAAVNTFGGPGRLSSIPHGTGLVPAMSCGVTFAPDEE